MPERAPRLCLPRHRSLIWKAPARTIAAEGPEPIVVAADLRKLDGCEHVFKHVQEKLHHCDVLVNNAGATRAGNFLELRDEAWLDGFALKFFGAVRLTVFSGRCSRQHTAMSSI